MVKVKFWWYLLAAHQAGWAFILFRHYCILIADWCNLIWCTVTRCISPCSASPVWIHDCLKWTFVSFIGFIYHSSRLIPRLQWKDRLYITCCITYGRSVPLLIFLIYSYGLKQGYQNVRLERERKNYIDVTKLGHNRFWRVIVKNIELTRSLLKFHKYFKLRCLHSL